MIPTIPAVPEFTPPKEAPVPKPKPLRKLARSQLRAFTIGQLKRQGGLCLVCHKPIDLQIKGEAVCDHDHTTGEIRGILHRSCNAALGKVDNAAGRWGAKSMEYPAIVAWLRSMLAYYDREGCGVIYPFHKTDDEKRLDRNKKAREARAKRAAQVAMKQRSS